MNVLSLFDGMSCGQIALERIGLKVDNYFASEIDKPAIKVTQSNYPNTKQLGDVVDVRAEDLPQIDLLIGGSPCQGFSFAGKQLNFEDPRSKLFFEFVRLLKECKPKYFMLENVKMRKEYQDVISSYLGVEPIVIKSSLFVPQNRERLYWTNIASIPDFTQKKYTSSDFFEGPGFPSCSDVARNFTEKSIFNTLTATYYKGIRGCSRPAVSIRESNMDLDRSAHRMLSPQECEALQTVPDNYTASASNSQRYRMLGNGWTVDVVAHIFKGMVDNSDLL